MSFLNILKPKVTVATHNGTFHADDVFAVATLSIWAEKEGKVLKIIRTRDQALIDSADIALDVGMLYDPNKSRFDHHQQESAGTHDNGLPAQAGIPYASFGLIWKHYGDKICSKDVADKIERRLAMPIDARDNGVNISSVNELGISDYRVADAIYSFNPTWIEGEDESLDRFNKAVSLARVILERELQWAEASNQGARLTREAIEAQGNPEILILDDRIDSKEEVVKHKNIKFIASRSKSSDNWSVISARDNLEDYNSNRADFPVSWRGLRDLELEKASGITGGIFCHKGGWFLKAKTREAALEMAKKALECYNTNN